MPCIWLQHNRQQIFLNLGIVTPQDYASFTSSGTMPSNPKMFKALLDTGATTTCISANAANLVGLTPVGKVPVMGVSGPAYHNNYLFYIAITLPRLNPADPTKIDLEVHIPNIQIQGAELVMPGGQFDMLLGMDIISTGSLAVEGNGTFSFSF